MQKAHSVEWALWLYWEPSYPSQSSGLFSRREAKLLASLNPGFTVLLFESKPQDAIKQKAHSVEWALWLYWEPGGVLLSHGNCHTTIVAAAFHF